MSFCPDDVAHVERAIVREALWTERVLPRVQLEVQAAVLDLQEPGFAEVADRHHAPGDAHARRGGERGIVESAEAGVHLRGALVRAEIVWIGRRSLLAQGGQLPPPDHDLLVVLRHASSCRKPEAFTGCRRRGQGTIAPPGSIRTSALRALAPTRSTTAAIVSLRLAPTDVNSAIVPPSGDGPPGTPSVSATGAGASPAGTAAALTR